METTGLLLFVAFHLVVRTHQNRFRKPAALLTLPGEVRNQIYRYVLVSKKRIRFDQTYREPNLLAACRQIWQEATPIFFVENKWRIGLPNWDTTLYSTWLRYVRRRGITDLTKVRRMVIPMSNPWRNADGILNFAKFVCEREGLFLVYDYSKDNDNRMHAAPCGAFEVARLMSQQGQSWESIKGVLAVYLIEIAKGGNGWQWG